MKACLIGCGGLLALGVVAVIALVAFGPALFRQAVGDQLVGAFSFKQVQVQPEAPTPDDVVSLKVRVAFAGSGGVPVGERQRQVTAEKAWQPDKRTAAVT